MKSAPPNFDSNSLFLYQIEDKYTKSFKNGFLGERMDPQYIEFYEHKVYLVLFIAMFLIYSSFPYLIV